MEVLYRLRKNLKKTQAEIAQVLGINQKTYSHYERGERSPDPETLKRLADYFNVSVDYILQRCDQTEYNLLINRFRLMLIEKGLTLAELEILIKKFSKLSRNQIMAFLDVIQ